MRLYTIVPGVSIGNPKAAAIYARISKDAQGSGLGVERQRELCEKLAGEKDWPIAHTYVDNDLSAYSGAPRPAYDRMLADLDSGTIDAVVVVDQDRLTRHPMELESFIITADRLGVPIANVSGEIDLSTSVGRFRARILGAVARQESEKKSERLRRQKDQSASRGWAQGGRRRYGYNHARTVNDVATLEIVPDEAEVVREVADRFLKGESLRTLAKDLNDRQIPTATGKTWRVTTLRTMLTGPHITGLRVHRGEIVGDGNWQPILDRATWERIRAIIGDPRRVQSGRPPAYLLTGFLECSQCGGTLHHSKRADSGRGRYACADGCGRIAISAEPAERIVTDALLDALDSPAMAEALVQADDLQGDAVGIAQQIEQAEAALEQLSVDHYADGLITRREYLAARDAVEAQIAELRDRLVPDTPHRLPAATKPLRELWAEADTDAKREIISAVVDRVVVEPGVVGRRTVDPGRLNIVWRV